MGHMGSTYLPADVYTRFTRIMGSRTVLTSGTDVHSIQVSQDGRTRKGSEALCAQKHAEYRAQLERMSVACDIHERTDLPEHVQFVYRVVDRLRRRGLIRVQKTPVLHCRSCGASPPERMCLRIEETGGTAKERYSRATRRQSLPEYRCPYCIWSPMEVVSSKQWFLPLAPHRDLIKEFVQRLHQPEVIHYLCSVLEQPLVQWCFTRDNRVGIAVTVDGLEKSLYLWFESMLGYVSMPRRLGVSPDYAVHFIGKNIIYYHGIVLPVLLAYGVDGAPERVALVARGFLDMRASDAEIVDIDRATSRWHRDYLRFYLLSKVPDSLADFQLTLREFEQWTRSVLRNKLGNLLRRMALLLLRYRSTPGRLNSCDPVVLHFRQAVVPDLRRELEAFRVRSAFMRTLEYGRFLAREYEARRFYEGPLLACESGVLRFMMASLLTILSPVIPSLAQQYGRLFHSWNPGELREIGRAVSSPLLATEPPMW